MATGRSAPLTLVGDGIENPANAATLVDVASEDAFVLLTAHTTGLDPLQLGVALGGAFGGAAALATEPVQLVATSGAVLPLGAAARMIRG